MNDYYITDDGFLVVLSGKATDKKDYAGVGYLISPMVRSSIIGFCQAHERYAALKLRSTGGKIAIITAYAPHAGYSLDKRLDFFHRLGGFY